MEYANSLGLGAIMLWSIETEDFLGLSGTKYPLLNAIQSALVSNVAYYSTNAFVKKNLIVKSRLTALFF